MFKLKQYHNIFKEYKQFYDVQIIVFCISILTIMFIYLLFNSKYKTFCHLSKPIISYISKCRVNLYQTVFIQFNVISNSLTSYAIKCVHNFHTIFYLSLIFERKSHFQWDLLEPHSISIRSAYLPKKSEMHSAHTQSRVSQ